MAVERSCCISSESSVPHPLTPPHPLTLTLGVENVLLIIGIQLKHPSMNFFPQKFYYIVDKAKELLNTLYDKVLEQEIQKTDEDGSPGEEVSGSGDIEEIQMAGHRRPRQKKLSNCLMQFGGESWESK